MNFDGLTKLSGDASFREFYRKKTKNNSIFIYTKKRRDPKTSPLFYVSLLFYYEHTNYLYFILLLCL